MTEYTLADLTKIVGAKRRSVQLWAEAGVIQADPLTERAGTGVARRFGWDEAVIACIIHAFAIRQVSIGHLLKLSGGLRTRLRRHEVRESIKSALRPSVDAAYLIIAEAEGKLQQICLYPRLRDQRDGTLWSNIGEAAAPDLLTKAADGMTFTIDIKVYLRNLA